MAITHTQNPAGQRSSGGTSLGVAVAAGNVGDLIHVASVVDGDLAATQSISDSQANTWFIIENDFSGSGNNRGKSWYCFAKNTSATTVTVTSSVTTTFACMVIDVFRGTASNSPIGSNNKASGTGTPTTGTITLDQNDEAIVVWSSDSITAVGNILGSAATKGADDGVQDWSEYRIMSGGSGNTGTAAFTGSGGYTIGYTVIKLTDTSAAAEVYPRRKIRLAPFAPGGPYRQRW